MLIYMMIQQKMMDSSTPTEEVERIEPCDASRAYLDTAFADIELRLEAGEFDIRTAEDKRLEAYDYAVKHIGVPRYELEIDETIER